MENKNTEEVSKKQIQNYYVLRFSNSELFIQTDLFSKTEELITKLESGTFSSSFIKLKQVNIERERNPVFYSKNSILSIEKVNPGMIGNNTKLWEIVK